MPTRTAANRGGPAARKRPAGTATSGSTALATAAAALAKLGLARDVDLALHLPLRYEDETRLVPMGELHDGETAQVEGTVRDARVQFRPRRQLVVTLEDGSGDLVLRFLHFWPSQQKTLAPGKRVRARGEARGGFFGMEMVHPVTRVVSPGTPLPTALTPVYPSTGNLAQAVLRKAVQEGLTRADLGELMPPGWLPAGLPPLREALRQLHEPRPGLAAEALEDRTSPAWQRLKFDELLAQQLSQLDAKRTRERHRAPALRGAAAGRDGRGRGVRSALLTALPFGLTAAQERVSAEIAADLARERPMNRLLQGDVGSGKTIVAALAAAVAIDTGWQCALMAPTEILAEQHLVKLVGWLAPLGVTVAWLTGSRKGKKRDEALAQIASGHAQLVVGTHAVIEEHVRFARLGLAIVDEQHRFGVAQRLALRDKLAERAGGEGEGEGMGEGAADAALRLEPHLLMLSATPIPRTLAMTLFADLDVSTLDTLPPGRTPIETRLFADGKRDQVIARIRDQIGAGQQVYWVCPLVEASAALDLQNATETHAALQAALPGHRVGLLHGRLPAAEKSDVMTAFGAGAIDVLVATTVIEVGVDVPNASLMVIEHAERFGLAQLHQLRGRVGRGAVASTCVLLYTPPLSDTGKARLKAMVETGDGFEIARRDLEIRGPGELLGARQSGAPLLRFADPLTDEDLVAAARTLAERWLDADPAAASRHVERWLGARERYLDA